MAVAYFYLILILLILPLLGIVFLAGLILLIVGAVTIGKPKNAGKKFPKVLLSIGALLFVTPALVFFIGIVPRFIGGFYQSVPEHWQKAWVSDTQAADEAIHALLESAGQGDRQALAKNFTAEIQNDPSFEAKLDDFLQVYPSALSQCELDGGFSGSSGSYQYGHNVLTGNASYTCDLKGERYFFELSYCYENTDEPEKVGVTYFSVRNLQARAVYVQEQNERDVSEEEEHTFLICEIKSSSEVNARLIDGEAFVWHPTSHEKRTEEEMRPLLSGEVTMASLEQEIGLPNASIKYRNSTGYYYYYELTAKLGEPRYAMICAASSSGRIIDAYVATPEKVFYDHPLKAFQNPDE